MPTYQIKILPSAKKDITSLPEPTRSRVIAAIDNLAEDPRPTGMRKMEGYKNMYRIRIGQYRVTD